MDCTTLPGAECDTDHILLVAKLRIRLYPKKRTPPPIRYDLDAFKDSNKAKAYSIATNNRFEGLQECLTEETSPEELWQSIKQIWHETAQEYLGKKQRRKQKPWVSVEAIELADKVKKARQQNNRVRRRKLKALLQRRLRKDKNEYIAKQCAEIDEFDLQNKSKDLYENVRRVKSKFSPRQACIRDING